MKFLILALALVFSPLAFAEHDGACKADVEKLCKDAPHDHGAIMKCMKDNESKVSTECKASWDAKKAQRKDLHEACHADAEKFCAGKEKHEMMKCMKENKEKLSAGCKAEWKEMKDQKHK